MSRILKIAVVILTVALLASLSQNLSLSRQKDNYNLQLSRLKLDPLGLAVYSSIPNPQEKFAIVLYGDSRIVDWSLPDAILSKKVVNRGISGQTTTQVLHRFPHHVAPLKPAVIVLQVGVNDLRMIPLFPDKKQIIIANCKANIEQIVQSSLTIGSQVVLTTIFPLGELPVEERRRNPQDVIDGINEVNAYISTLASDRVKILDTGEILTNAQGVVEPKYSRDFLHLNRRGYEALNQKLLVLLESDLKGKKSRD